MCLRCINTNELYSILQTKLGKQVFGMGYFVKWIDEASFKSLICELLKEETKCKCF